MPKRNQSATATKKTLNLRQVSTGMRVLKVEKYSHRNDRGEDRARPRDKCEESCHGDWNLCQHMDDGFTAM